MTMRQDLARQGSAATPKGSNPVRGAPDPRAQLRVADKHAKDGHHAQATEAYVSVGEELARQGFARRAIGAFTQALESAKRDPAAIERVGAIARSLSELYLREKLTQDAVATLDAVTRVLVERAADAAVVPVLEARLAIEVSAVVQVRLVETLLRLGEVERAAAGLEAMFRRAHAAGHRDDAIEAAERLLLHRRDASVARTCAELYLARNRPGDAFHALAKLRICCEHDASHVPTLQLLARAFELARHPDKASRVRREIAAQQAPPSKARPSPVPRQEDSTALAAHAIEAGWDELAAKADEELDVGRPSFWNVGEAPAGTSFEGSVAEVSLADVEVVTLSVSAGRTTLLEAVLESVDALITQSRYGDAAALVERELAVRPGNPLLLERQIELDAMPRSSRRTPPPLPVAGS